jgi:hypothetical protein
LKTFQAIKCRLLVSIDRGRGADYALKTLEAIKKIHPHSHLVGVDVSGHPKAAFVMAEYQAVL